MTNRAPRIDTVRNRITATTALLDKTLTVIDLVHELAYSRSSRRGDEPNVASGHRDYALDNHGDPKARTAYRHLTDALDAALDPIAIACHEALTAINDGETPGTNRMHPATINLLELKVAIDAQRRRTEQGEQHARQFPQPKAAKAAKAHELEVAKLRRQLADRDRKIDKLQARLNRRRDDRTNRGASTS